MWEKLRVIFTITELRKRIVLTLLLLAIYRVGYQIPLPVLNQMVFGSSQSDGGQGLGKLMQQASLFSAADLKHITIFGLGIMPYISASIILQLLSSVWKPLEDLRKEGETGRKKINEYTRYLTVLLCLIQSSVWLWTSAAPGVNSSIHPEFMHTDANTGIQTGMYLGWSIVSLLIMTSGTVFLMWIGEQIDEYGVGNGISLIIMAGILAQMPSAIIDLFNKAELKLTRFEGIGIESIVLLIILFIAVVFGVVFITLGKRSIQVQSAKHVRGRRVMGGNRQGLLLRINQSGVMPIIFASSLLLLPSMVFSYASAGLHSYNGDGSFFDYTYRFFLMLNDTFSRGTSVFYNLLYIAMIYFFCYFWTAITFNPKEMAENLKDHGTFIPGYRPGRRTADYLESVMTRITYVGAAFLSLVAIVPNIISTSMNIPPAIASFYGGTALLIAVSVAFDIVQKIDSHLVMRNYRGLLES
jgi:preprotein translocase subunit SecY